MYSLDEQRKFNHENPYGTALHKLQDPGTSLI